VKNGRRLKSMLLCTLDVASLDGIDANAIALVNEGWNLDGDAVFQGGGFIDVGNGRPFHRWLGLADRQLQRWRQVDSDGRTLVKLRLNLQSGTKPLRRIAQLIVTQGSLIVRLRVHEMVVRTVGIQVLHFMLFERGALDCVS